MKNIAIVNLIDVSAYFFEKIDGESQLERVIKYAKSLPNIKGIKFLLTKKIDTIDNFILSNSWDVEVLMEHLLNESKGYDHMFYFYGDCPLLDIDLSNQMFHDHINFYAEYTFADGYPYGLTPEILDTEILKPLCLLAKENKTPVLRNTLFDVVKKDINSFELETKIAQSDLRLLRVSLTSDNKRNFNLLKRVIREGGSEHLSVTNVLLSKPEILLTEPSYINLDITRMRRQESSYLPSRAGSRDFLPLEEVKTILDKVKLYCDDAIFSFVPEYEPTTHPDLLNIIRSITMIEGFSLYIETSGLGWSSELKNEIVENSNVFIIVTLDALNPQLYSEIRGEGQEEATIFAKDMITLMKDRTYVQATRSKINEGDMELFYRHWQSFTENIIIQKYSDYNKSLPNLKVADLSPLKRFPCWHIKRDLFVDINGDVLLCFNDLKGKFVLGSLTKGTIGDIMEKKAEYYKEHIKCEYSDFCRKCDEYYTFNF